MIRIKKLLTELELAKIKDRIDGETLENIIQKDAMMHVSTTEDQTSSQQTVRESEEVHTENLDMTEVHIRKKIIAFYDQVPLMEVRD